METQTNETPKQGKQTKGSRNGIELTRSTFEISLGSKGSKANWNTVVPVNIDNFSPEVITWLIELGLAYTIRGAVGKDTTDPTIAESEARARLAELEAGITAKRRTAATAIERKAREIALEEVRFAAAKQGKNYKTEDLARYAEMHFDRHRERLESKAQAMLEEAKRQAEGIDVDFSAT